MENFHHMTIDGSEAVQNCFGSGRPVRFEQGGVFLCLRGECEIVIDMKQFRIAAGDIVTAFPYSVIQVVRHSGDFGDRLIGAEVNFFASIQIPDKSSYYLHIKENPCVTPTQEEWDGIVSLYRTLSEERVREDHPLRSEIDVCRMKILICEIAAVYAGHKPIGQQSCSRRERIFQQFVFSLFGGFPVRRSLEYYAGEQSITPRHLSMVVKQVSGQTAGEWITGCLVANIKSRLQNPDLSIAQIADESGFPNASFFAQYFKKYSGLTPREYRASLAK